VRGRLVGAFFQCLGCAALLLLHADSPAWLLVALSAVVGIPHGLIGLANQNALYAQAAPARMGSSAGLLRTFMYIGALFAAAASAVFLRDGATSSGLHAMAWVLIGVAAVFLVLCTADRSLGRVGATPGDAALTPRKPPSA
jgi:sugar phosphate permease